MRRYHITVYSGNDTILEKRTSSIKDAFIACQYRFGHCLGRIRGNAGERIGWIFSKCEDCSIGNVPAIFEVYINQKRPTI